jgi:hydroxymethylglutaryl-CoA reductase (NADPH)
MLLMNAENTPSKWNETYIKECISSATRFHKEFESALKEEAVLANCKQEFKAWKANELYNKIIDLLVREEENKSRKLNLNALKDAALELESMASNITIPKTIIHNDYNPRNIAIDKEGKVLIYDWELALVDYPHRDIVELLSFTLKEDFTEQELLNYLNYHSHIAKKESTPSEDWNKVYYYATLELIVSRLLFYEVAGIVVKYDFSERVLNTALKMLQILKQYA